MHAYRLCNSNNLQMSDKYIMQNCWSYKVLGNKSGIFLEIGSVTNVSYVRIYILVTMDYPNQF